MKMGFITSLLDGWSYEEMMDEVARIGIQCVEVACWPKGKAERKYGGVTHIEIDRVLEDDEYARHILDYAKEKGVDICAPAGTPIYASASGVVTKAGYERAGAGTGYGNSLIIDHGNGYSTLYSHCLSLTVSAGQAVSQGQLIVYVGSTGRSTGNHCHFEIRQNGRYLPPQNYFNK